MVLCKCGCEQELDFSRGRKRKEYISGHQFKKRIFTPEYREKLSISKLGSKNPMFGKGPNPGSFKKGEHRSKETEFKCLESTPLHKAIRSLNIMTEWKAWIKEWDNYTCQKCGKVGGKLHSHHIKRVSDIIKEYNLKNINDALQCKTLWDIGNGITYCVKCHNLLNKKGGLL